MAISVSTVWEAKSTGASTNGGGFNVGNANFATDLAATVANTSAPVVTSASYTFVAGDVGAMLFVKSGTNWIPGWYPIASVTGGAATLTASIGSANLYGGATVLNTAAGCASVASPTAGTWSVDYSQQAAAQFAFTDLVIGATTTQFTSVANPVGKNMVGNIMQVVSGTGFTTGWFEVVSTSTITATCDRSLGTTASTGGHANLGGCLDGFATAASAAVAANKIFVQTSGGFTSATTTTFAQSTGGIGLPTRLIGYTTYRGDNGRAVLTLATNTGLTGVAATGQGLWVENIEVNCASLGTSVGIGFTGYRSAVRNCKVSNFTKAGIYFAGGGNGLQVINNEITGGTSAALAAINVTQLGFVIEDNNVHDNACPGIIVNSSYTAPASIRKNLVTNNTGASSDGIRISGEANNVTDNIIHGNGRHGINLITATAYICQARNNILSTNGGYGVQAFSSAGWPAVPENDGNAYYANTSGTRHFMDDVGAVNPVDGVATYVNVLDVILTQDPFVAKASGDFRLNTTAGGGAACRGFGVPQTWPGNSLTVSSLDMGAVQHADPSAATYVLNQTLVRNYVNEGEY
jgi:hypothetical protein